MSRQTLSSTPTKVQDGASAHADGSFTPSGDSASSNATPTTTSNVAISDKNRDEMRDNDDDEDEDSATISTAIIYASVNIAAAVLLAVAYFNAVLLAPYWRPLFWAAALALPLRALKARLVEACESLSVLQSSPQHNQTPTYRIASLITWAYLGDTSLRILRSIRQQQQQQQDQRKRVLQLLREACTVEFRRRFEQNPKPSHASSPASTRYLTRLFRVVLWFFTIRTILALGATFYLRLLSRILQLTATVLIYKATKVAVSNYATRESSSVAHLFLMALECISTILRVIWTAVKSGMASLFTTTPQRANSVATNIVIVGTLLIVAVCTVILAAKILEEIGYLMASIAVTANSYVSDDMRQRAQAGLEKLYATVADWVQTKFPGSLGGATADAMASADAESTSVYALRFIETRLPKLSALVTTLRSGSTPSSPELLLAGIADELRDAFATLVTSLPSQTAALVASISPSHVTTAAGDLFGFLISTSIRLSAFVQSAIDAILYFIFFVGALYFLVSQTNGVNDNNSLFSSLARAASSIDKEGALTSAFSRRLNAIIGCSIKLALFHTTLTWLTHAAFGAPLIYIPMAAVAILSLIPLLWATYVPLLSALAMYLSGAGVLRALALAVTHIAASTLVDSAFLAEIPDVDPFFSALSFILGLWAFGIEGLVLGPLLMTVLPTLAAFLSSKRASAARRRQSLRTRSIFISKNVKCE